MADKELDKANKGYKQYYEDERKENEETRELITKPARAVKDKIMSVVGPAWQAAFDKKAAKDAAEKAEKDEINKSLDGNASTRTRLNMGKLPEKAANMKKGGKVSSASKRADGCCIRGKTKA